MPYVTQITISSFNLKQVFTVQPHCVKLVGDLIKVRDNEFWHKPLCSVKPLPYMLRHPPIFNACFNHFKNTFPQVTSIQVTLPYQYTVFNNDFNKYNWKQWRSRTSFRIAICFRDVGSLRAFICEPFLITRINQEYLLAI